MLDLNLDMNSFEPEKIDINQNTNVIPGLQNTNIDEEEQKRILEREKEAELRKERINKKIQEEEEKRNEIRIKAAEFMAEFNQKRQEEIEKRKKLLEEKTENKNSEDNQDTWSNVKNNIDLKDSEYKGSKDVQRMREAMLNNPNSQPMQNIFG